jgi:hypothetical protein
MQHQRRRYRPDPRLYLELSADNGRNFAKRTQITPTLRQDAMTLGVVADQAEQRLRRSRYRNPLDNLSLRYFVATALCGVKRSRITPSLV